MPTSRHLLPTRAMLFKGTSEEARQELAHHESEHTIVLSLPDKFAADTYVALLNSMDALLPGIIERRRREAIQGIIDALTPSRPLPSGELAQAKMTADARTQVIDSGQFITAAQVADLAGYSKSNPSAAPSRWKKERQIFSITHRGIDYFPLFALNPDDNYRPYGAMEEILSVFGDSLSGWGIASWFVGLNSFLDDQTPKDLLSSDPEWVIEAARDAIGEMSHA